MSDWYYARDGRQAGPVELSTLQGLMQSGELRATDLVWAEGMPQWVPADLIPALAGAGAPKQAIPMAQPAVQPMPMGYGQGMQPGDPAPPPGLPLQSVGPQAYLPYATPPVEDSKYANLAMVGMILSVVAFAAGSVFVGIPGGICGWVALRGMKRTGNTRNKGLAIAAVSIGAFWALALVAVVAGICYFVFIERR
jgi:hypothetical protein